MTSAFPYRRNAYVDMLRGVAALGIVAIHTACWAGNSYVPRQFLSITLALDVPFFFFLSGWGASLHQGNIVNSSKRLGIIWLQWIAFITLAGVSCTAISFFLHSPYGLRGFNSAGELFDSYVFHVTLPRFEFLGGSLWFMPHYFVVVLVNTAITTLLSRYENADELKKWYCAMLAAVFIWITAKHYFFNLDTYFVFYSFFWMLGYNRRHLRVDTVDRLVKWWILMFVGYVLSSRWLHLPVGDVQNTKFPPTIQYAFWSMPAIFLGLFLEAKIPPPQILVHIGRNAIFYFFAQGVSCTINFFFVKWITLSNWFLKWSITFILCVLISVVIAESLSLLWKWTVALAHRTLKSI